MSPPNKVALPSTPPHVDVVGYGRGMVKQVLCGDTVIIRGRTGSPPPEKLLGFLHVLAPKMARRPSAGGGGTNDEPWAWDSREFLRKKLIGQEVYFSYSKPQDSNREYGYVWLGSDESGENIVETMVKEGLVTVWREGRNADDTKRLIELEDQAKAAGRGKWAHAASSRAEKIRDIKWVQQNPGKIVDLYGGKPVRAVIELVRDGSTVRAMLLPEFNYITLMISGIKCPGRQFDDDGKPNMSLPAFADEARAFVEQRLLQRDVKVVIESESKGNYVGTILFPKGNIAEALLREGLAQCIDWSLASMKSGAERLRAAERVAKEKRLRLWQNYQPNEYALSAILNTFSGTVVEVFNGDSINVKLPNGEIKKVFFASVRPPRGAGEDGANARGKNLHPLYEAPFTFEAHEFLRKNFIDQKVQCKLDYITPARDPYPEKYCYTVLMGDVNVAEAIVAKGLVTCFRYRQDDDQRSSAYDQLLAAENRAIKSKRGMHGTKNKPLRIKDLTNDNSCIKKHFLASWQRAERTDAVVDFVASSSRLRIYMPKDSCLVTLFLAGISSPLSSRPALNGVPAKEGDPYGDEALQFTRDLVLQRDVKVHIESAKANTAVIGWLWTSANVNIAVALVEEGLARVHFSAETTQYFHQLKDAEKRAQAAKKNIWADYVESPAVDEKANDDKMPEKRMVSFKSVIITEVTSQLTFFAQSVDKGAKLETLMSELRSELRTNPPVIGSHKFKRGELCAAQFSEDNLWYRAKVERLGGQQATVTYIDYGNKETLPFNCIAPLPTAFHQDCPFATEHALALIQLPPDDDDKEDARRVFAREVLNRQVDLNVELSVSSGPKLATLHSPETKVDIGKKLVADGLALVDMRRERALKNLVKQYKAAEQAARTTHLAIWKYGDITKDDA